MMPCINHTNFFLDTVNTVMMIHISCNKHLTARLQDIGIHPLSGSRAHGNLSDCRLRISITSYLRQIKGFSDQRRQFCQRQLIIKCSRSPNAL